MSDIPVVRLSDDIFQKVFGSNTEGSDTWGAYMPLDIADGLQRIVAEGGFVRVKRQSDYETDGGTASFLSISCRTDYFPGHPFFVMEDGEGFKAVRSYLQNLGYISA